jgi:hypothetical protein
MARPSLASPPLAPAAPAVASSVAPTSLVSTLPFKNEPHFERIEPRFVFCYVSLLAANPIDRNLTRG